MKVGDSEWPPQSLGTGSCVALSADALENKGDVAIEKRRDGYTIEAMKGTVKYHSVVKEQERLAFIAQRRQTGSSLDQSSAVKFWIR